MADGSVMPAFNLMGWVDDNAEHFKPPVGNKYLYSGRDFFVMIIKGPNAILVPGGSPGGAHRAVEIRARPAASRARPCSAA